MSATPEGWNEIDTTTETTPTIQDLCENPADPVTVSVTRLPSTSETIETPGGYGKRTVRQLRFHVVLTFRRQTIETPYGMGEGHIKPPAALGRKTVDSAAYLTRVLANPDKMNGPTPTAADVLASLFCDASCWEESRDVEYFAANFGGDVKSMADARKIERMYQDCGETAKKLRQIFGKDYQQFAEAASQY